MFERLQQPITFKLPRRGRRREVADGSEQGTLFEGVIDNASELETGSDAENAGFGTRLGDREEVAPSTEQHEGREQAADSPAPAVERPADHAASAPQTTPVAHADATAASELAQSVVLPSELAVAPTGPLGAATTALGNAPAPLHADTGGPRGDAAAFHGDASSTETPALRDGDSPEPGFSPAVPVVVPTAPATLVAVSANPSTTDGNGVAAEDVASDTPPAESLAAPSVASRAKSLRAKHVSMRRRGSTGHLIGLDIEPGQIVAVRAHVNGEVVVERAVGAPLAAGVIRDGEVNDPEALSDALRTLFAQSKLDRRVRIGIANQRIVMRRIDLPPIKDPKEIANAVRFQAADEIPMPLDSVVLDYHSLGISDTAAGPRLHVVLVAARRDMVERVLDSARSAGLRPEGVDLAAFAMIRALRHGPRDSDEQVLYLSIGGITNLAIATGATCEFTRAIGTGIEQIIAEVAARCGVAIGDARRLLAHVARTRCRDPACRRSAAPVRRGGRLAAHRPRGDREGRARRRRAADRGGGAALARLPRLERSRPGRGARRALRSRAGPARLPRDARRRAGPEGERRYRRPRLTRRRRECAREQARGRCRACR